MDTRWFTRGSFKGGWIAITLRDRCHPAGIVVGVFDDMQIDVHLWSRGWRRRRRWRPRCALPPAGHASKRKPPAPHGAVLPSHSQLEAELFRCGSPDHARRCLGPCTRRVGDGNALIPARVPRVREKSVCHFPLRSGKTERGRSTGLHGENLDVQGAIEVTSRKAPYPTVHSLQSRSHTQHSWHSRGLSPFRCSGWLLNHTAR